MTNKVYERMLLFNQTWVCSNSFLSLVKSTWQFYQKLTTFLIFCLAYLLSIPDYRDLLSSFILVINDDYKKHAVTRFQDLVDNPKEKQNLFRTKCYVKRQLYLWKKSILFELATCLYFLLVSHCLITCAFHGFNDLRFNHCLHLTMSSCFWNVRKDLTWICVFWLVFLFNLNICKEFVVHQFILVVIFRDSLFYEILFFSFIVNLNPNFFRSVHRDSNLDGFETLHGFQ